jgi:hypothetical protein
MRGDQHPERLPVARAGSGQRPVGTRVDGWSPALCRAHRHTVTPRCDSTDEFIPEPGSDTDEGADPAPLTGKAWLIGAPFVWFDLTVTADGEGVRDFYAGLFGWTVGPERRLVPGMDHRR